MWISWRCPWMMRKTFEMLTRGETVGVFQLESMGMRKALIGMKPDQFEDIIALVALVSSGSDGEYSRLQRPQEW